MGKPLLLFSICLTALLMSGSDNASSYQLLSFAEHLRPESSRVLWYKSARLGNADAAHRLLVSAVNDKCDYWLEQVAKLPVAVSEDHAAIKHQGASIEGVSVSSVNGFNSIKSQAAYTLAIQANNARKRLYWFTFASDLHHAQSQFELSLLLEDDNERLQLLKASANNHYVPAIITLAKFYHHNISILPAANDALEQRAHIRAENQKLALYWLEKSAQYDAASAFDLGLLHWQASDKDAAKGAFERSAKLGFEKGHDYLQVLLNQSQTDIVDIFIPKGTSLTEVRSGWCAQQLQFVASSLETVVRANQIKQRFEQDERFSELSICVNAVVWLPKQSLACANQSINTRIKCDLSALAAVLKYPTFTHLVVFADIGKAYVQRGVMYLDRADEYSVFVHELAHFAAFVDEYALSATMAQMQCLSASAPNLMVANETGEWNDTKMQLWQSASEESLEIAPSRTCQRDGKASFKPSADITFLEHHDTENIPVLYQYLWQHQLANQQAKIEAPNEFLYISRRAGHAEKIAHWQAVLSD